MENDCAYRKLWVRGCPLLYLIRDVADVPTKAYDPLINRNTYGESGSSIDKRICRLNHQYPIFNSESAAVYYISEEALRGANYTPMIKPCSREKDGTKAFLAMVFSHISDIKRE